MIPNAISAAARVRETSAVDVLLLPATIRERCQNILAACERDELQYFRYNPDNLAACEDYVDNVIRSTYPELEIPFHSRWRHLERDGKPLVDDLFSSFGVEDRNERARIAFDLVILSVLLDAGAGSLWRYCPLSGSQPIMRSEGLAIASYDLFASGVFSSNRNNPLQANADALVALTEDAINSGFQVSASNPLVGVSGRTRLLNGVGHVLRNRPDVFGPTARIGNLFDFFVERADGAEISIAVIFDTVLRVFGEAWPSGRSVDGVSLGDVWPHAAAGGEGRNQSLVPFHKLSQWLTYSLVEPLEAAGISVTNLDCLTGLPEYRNGGLLIDSDVLTLREPNMLNVALTPGHPCVVEWRALTVALLDELANGLRRRYDMSPDQLPLVRVLEGGTWRAGRLIARDRRPDGTSPILLASDGTVF